MAHTHSHAAANYGRAFAIGITLNLAFVFIEFVYGSLSHSLALVADAGHNLSDVLALGLAWGASAMSQRRPTATRTYGYRRSSILAALTNAVVLLIALGAIAWEAVRRFSEPAPVMAGTVMWVAGAGVLINGATAWMFASGSKDVNIRSAFLHMAADALVSVGVMFSAFVILFTGWTWLDPAVTLIIVTIIVMSSWALLRDSLNLALDAVPASIDLPAVETYLASRPNVLEVHDLHVWGMSTTEAALTAHLVLREPECDNRFLTATERELHERFGIEHATLQLEVEDPDHACGCRLA